MMDHPKPPRHRPVTVQSGAKALEGPPPRDLDLVDRGDPMHDADVMGHPFLPLSLFLGLTLAAVPVTAQVKDAPSEGVTVTPADGTAIAALAKDNATWQGLLSRLQPKDRAAVEAMTLEHFIAGTEADESPDPAIEATVTAAKRLDEVALWTPQLASLLAHADPSMRAELAALDPERLSGFGDADPATLTPEDQRIMQAFGEASMAQDMDQFAFQTGDATLGDGLATLHLGDEYHLLSPDDAERILTEYWGNPPSSTKPLGLLVPKDVNPLTDSGWAIIITYSEDGHIKDDDAEDIDYDDLLKDLREDQDKANARRQEVGAAAMHLEGWAARPHYDPENHRLHWAMDFSTDDQEEHTLNYAVRILGRKGVLELNAVSGMDQLAAVQPAMEQVLTTVEFATGHRYNDFDPDLDHVAAYGIGGLIAGKIALKTGLLAGLLKFAGAGWKLIVGVFVALGAFVSRLFGRNTRDET